MSNYWISWYNTPDLSEFELHTPWWVSGVRADDDANIVVAAVKAIDEDCARTTILDCYDEVPESLEWRFVEERGKGWSPFSDRFPKADWMAWVGDKTCNCRVCKSVEPFPITKNIRRRLEEDDDPPIFEPNLDRIFPRAQ